METRLTNLPFSYPYRTFFSGHCFWKRTRQPVDWLSRKLYFFAGNSLRTDRNLMVFADSLLNHLDVHHKQLMPSMCITFPSWAVYFQCTEFSGHLKGCNLCIVQIILQLVHMANEGCGDRQDLLMWLISCFENEMQYEPGNKLDKPLTGWSCSSEIFFSEWNHCYWGSV